MTTVRLPSALIKSLGLDDDDDDKDFGLDGEDDDCCNNDDVNSFS